MNLIVKSGLITIGIFVGAFGVLMGTVTIMLLYPPLVLGISIIGLLAFSWYKLYNHLKKESL